MSVIDTELPFTLVDLCVNVSVTFMAAVLMCVFSGYFAATLPPIIFFCWILQKFYLRTSRQIRILELQAKSPLFTHFLDTLQGLPSVRAFRWDLQFREQYLQFLDASQRPYYLLFCIQRWLAVVLDLTVAVMATILMTLVVELRGQFAPKFVALALLNVTSFGKSLTLVIRDYTQLETSLGAVSRINEFCLKTEDENLPGEVVVPPSDWPSNGRVEIRNLTASYTVSKDPVLHGANLDIPAGSKIGICGRSGSGKSSLLACLLRLLEVDPQSTVKFDGIDITTVPRQTLRAAVAMEEVIEKLGGLDAILDVDRLSQGQRQLLCLAKAMLANKRIILLDEASSNVDAKSEQLIRRVIREEFVSSTVIAVVHRLGAVVDFDRVAVMKAGRVVEWDNPRALLQQESEFKRLWDLSSG
ncbi:Multidrug resistance-associated 1 [Fusarium albosuccineum]|uniref:Multidrug resistance-associated 1 n=1 Tax=Fusarium albosuccineum TaxID=1237068 RepID=A0A8H4L6G1_9HYPO|nr:Multidrug resistance-associated 1 [Fusarium albosuccineum]